MKGDFRFLYLKLSFSGLICVYSLKNPSFPEFTYATESGVMSLDFHPEHPYLVAVGFYDGGVAVYNLREKTTGPVYSSCSKSGKHADTVWQVYWQENDLVIILKVPCVVKATYWSI